ncbi:hypothetical protein DFAR_860003 [Desulfarculales bacterium]
MILCRSNLVQRLDLADSGPAAPASFIQQVPWPPQAADLEGDLLLSLNDYLERCERHYLEALLAAYRGSNQDSAKAAGVNPKMLYLKRARHGLSKKDYRQPPSEGLAPAGKACHNNGGLRGSAEADLQLRQALRHISRLAG